MKLPNTLTEGRVVQLIRAELKRWSRKNPSGGGGASALGDLTDVTLTSPTNTQVLTYDGTGWVNDNMGDIDGGSAASVYLTSQTLDGGGA